MKLLSSSSSIVVAIFVISSFRLLSTAALDTVTPPDQTTPDTLCTSNFTGTSSCNFDKSHCNYESFSNRSGLKWVRYNGTHGPIPYDWNPGNRLLGATGYTYLAVSDTSVPLQAKALISGAIANDVTAVCIEFHYATSGQTPQTIRVYIQQSEDFTSRNTGGSLLIDELTNTSTSGEWKPYSIPSLCLPESWNLRFLAIESEKRSPIDTVAIDYLKVTRSTKPCTATTQSPVTSASTITSTTTPTTIEAAICTSNFTGTPSCNFDRSHCNYESFSNSSGLKWVRYNGTHGPIPYDWDPGNRPSGTTGGYTYLAVSDTSVPLQAIALISGAIANDVTAVCIEFHYATSGQTPQTIRVYIQQSEDFTSRNTGGSLLIDELANVTTSGEWKPYSIPSICLPESWNLRFLAIESEKTSPIDTVAIDYLKVTRSTKTCPTTTQSQGPSTSAISTPTTTTASHITGISSITPTRPTTTTTSTSTTGQPLATTTKPPTMTTTRLTKITTMRPTATTQTTTDIPVVTTTPTTSSTTTPTVTATPKTTTTVAITTVTAANTKSTTPLTTTTRLTAKTASTTVAPKTAAPSPSTTTTSTTTATTTTAMPLTTITSPSSPTSTAPLNTTSLISTITPSTKTPGSKPTTTNAQSPVTAHGKDETTESHPVSPSQQSTSTLSSPSTPTSPRGVSSGSRGSSDDGLSESGKIAVIAVCSVVGVVLIAIAAVFLIKKRGHIFRSTLDDTEILDLSKVY